LSRRARIGAATATTIRFASISISAVLLAYLTFPYLAWQGYAAGLQEPLTFLLFFGVLAVVLGGIERWSKWVVSSTVAFVFGFFTYLWIATEVEWLSYASAPWFELLIFAVLFVSADAALLGVSSSRWKRSVACTISAFGSSAFLFIFFGWNSFPVAYAKSVIFSLLFVGGFALTMLLSSPSKWAKMAGIAILGTLLFFIFVPAIATPYSTQYTSLSYAYLGIGGVYNSGSYWVGAGLSAG
jgi:hypothetical protein